MYGAILNAGCRFFDHRIGQSTTLTGRIIAKHMDSFVNEAITGKYDHTGDAIIYGDTDSEIGTTIHQTNFGEKEIQELFANCSEFWNDGDKEYAYHPDLMVMSYDNDKNQPYFGHINYIYRHKVSKDLYEITDSLDNTITVTEDHSVMIERNGILMETKPVDITDTDILISIKNINQKTISLHRAPVKSVKLLRKAEDEYVYDIGMKNESKPWFFGNNILIHNSVYFSAWPIIKEDVAAGNMEWNKDICVQLYDSIADSVNDSFPAFMERACHCPREMGSIIKAGRELIAVKGLFITKKRYAVLIYDLEGTRLDVNGKSGKVKAMGLDLKRSDTPKIVQDFLSEILMDVLNSQGNDVKQQVIDKIRNFKLEFKQKPAWEKGTPKRVNNLTKYTAEEARLGRANMPGHVRAAMNWNSLKRIFNDNYSMQIVDGMKTIVCKLKDNPVGYESVGYPTDETHLPQWFKDLPFDHEAMEGTIVDKKVDNLLGVLEWNLAESTDIKTTFDSLFDWG